MLAEIKGMRACVIEQTAALKPASRPDLLELCRQDVQRRLSPPGPIRYGTLRMWRQAVEEKGYWESAPIMHGWFDTGGDTGFSVRTRCDIQGGRLNDAVELTEADK